jgi:hypothetical protein
MPKTTARFLMDLFNNAKVDLAMQCQTPKGRVFLVSARKADDWKGNTEMYRKNGLTAAVNLTCPSCRMQALTRRAMSDRLDAGSLLSGAVYAWVLVYRAEGYTFKRLSAFTKLSEQNVLIWSACIQTL